MPTKALNHLPFLLELFFPDAGVDSRCGRQVTVCNDMAGDLCAMSWQSGMGVQHSQTHLPSSFLPQDQDW